MNISNTFKNNMLGLGDDLRVDDVIDNFSFLNVIHILYTSHTVNNS